MVYIYEALGNTRSLLSPSTKPPFVSKTSVTNSYISTSSLLRAPRSNQTTTPKQTYHPTKNRFHHTIQHACRSSQSYLRHHSTAPSSLSRHPTTTTTTTTTKPPPTTPSTWTTSHPSSPTSSHPYHTRNAHPQCLAQHPHLLASLTHIKRSVKKGKHT